MRLLNEDRLSLGPAQWRGKKVAECVCALQPGEVRPRTGVAKAFNCTWFWLLAFFLGP